MDIKHCRGCYNNFYNWSQNICGSNCWHLETAKLIKRKRVSIHQRPPWNQKAETLPSCYQQQGYIFVAPDRTN